MAANATLNRPPLPSGPGPSSIGAACPKCKGTRFTTTIQTFKDGTEHLRMSCAACKAFVRYAPKRATPEAPAFEYQPRPADAHQAELKPPPANCRWLGFIRPGDGTWYPVADCATLHGCWEALLTTHQVGDRLCVPVMPHQHKAGAKRKETSMRDTTAERPAHPNVLREALILEFHNEVVRPLHALSDSIMDFVTGVIGTGALVSAATTVVRVLKDWRHLGITPADLDPMDRNVVSPILLAAAEALLDAGRTGDGRRAARALRQFEDAAFLTPRVPTSWEK